MTLTISLGATVGFSQTLGRAEAPEKGVPQRVAPASRASTLTGVVSDVTGSVLPGAVVELRSSSGPIALATVVSQTDGTFAFTELQAGSYRLRVMFPGLATADQPVIVTAASPTSVTIVLSPAGVQEQVVIHPPAPATTPTLPSQGATGGLNALITLTAPGVAADSNGVFHPLGEHAETSFSIDGQPITDQQSRTFSNPLPASAIESLDIQTGVPAPEFGDKTSLVAQATTRSGLGHPTPSGEASISYGSFRSPTASLTFGVGSGRVGNFMAVDDGVSHRFLDAPEAVTLHDRGNVYNLFDRLDGRLAANTDAQLNFFAARSTFQTPNTFDQDRAGQDQQQRQWTLNVAPSVRHVLTPHSVLELNGWMRHDHVDYLGSSHLIADQPAVLTQHRTLTNLGGKAVWSWTTNGHAVKAGLQETSTALDEHFQTGLTDPTFNTPCLSGSGDPVADTSLRDPGACAASGFVPNPSFLPALLPYDLTRGGALFTFDGRGRINEGTAYLQDVIAHAAWTVMVGARFDVYDGLSQATGLQPRVGVTYRVDRTRTTLRASYGRMFLTPYNENLVLASSTGGGGFGGGVPGALGGAPLVPAKRNQYDLGIDHTSWRGIQVGAEYFWKVTADAYDFDVIFNTPLAFPVQFRESRINGGLVRVTLPELHGWRAYTTLSHTKSLLYGPELGGLRFSADYAPVAAPDHDEPFAANAHLEYHAGGRWRPWAGLTWRYDSGLVAVAVPTYEAALRLNGDEQAAMGLYCGQVFATPSQPVRECSAASYGATRINIPAPGTENDATNPPRITPHHLVDIAVGLDAITVGKVPLRLRLTVVNLLDTVALYNFLSTFSGTHFVTPRAAQLQLVVPF